MFAVLCNEDGYRDCGSDTVIRIDGRLSIENRLDTVRGYRDGFKKHLPTKYNRWTHCYFVHQIHYVDVAKPSNIFKL